MSGSSPRTSSPHNDPLFYVDPPQSAPQSADSPRLPGALRSGGVSGGHADCRLVDVHGARVASFAVDGVVLICLPQVFELFLKHLVGGLHTVYTKLKRLHISPVVCTVEQVRVLRGLGAIQPGVNRCKLISRADFETLYRDCATASSRPGRPPKRTLGVANLTDGPRLLPRSLLSSALLSQTGLTTAMAEALKLQKMRMMMRFHGNCDQQQGGAELEKDDTVGGSEGSWEKGRGLLSPPSSLAASPAGPPPLSALQQRSTLLANRLPDFPFMVMPHPLLPVGLPPASVAMAMNQMSQLSSLANMAAALQRDEDQRHLQDESATGSPAPSPSPSEDYQHPQEPASQSPSRESSRSSSSSSSPPPEPELDRGTEEPEGVHNKDDCMLPLPILSPTNKKPPLVDHMNAFAPLLLAEGLSSMETLLTNVQGLLKVAVESSRCQNHQNQLERKELKLELDRERDVRQTLQRRLSSELETRASMQRRLKKEKKAKRRLQEALDFQSRRREEAERALHLSDSFTDAETPESERENKQQNSAAHENLLFIKPLLF